MRNFLILVCWLSIATCLQSQNSYVSPFPNGGTPCAGGVLISSESNEELAALPQLILSEKSASTRLPYKVDNSKKKYFRPIFRQDGGSCGIATEIGYIFT